MKNLLTQKQVMEYLQVSKPAFKSIMSGSNPLPYITVGKRKRFRASHIDEWYENNKKNQ